MEEFSRVIKSVVYLFNGGYFGVYLCQNSLTSTLKIDIQVVQVTIFQFCHGVKGVHIQ